MRTIASLLVALLLLLGPAGAVRAGDRDAEASPPAQQKTYESPVLSLILLPVNVLIKMASLLGPDETAKQRSAAPSEPPANGEK